MLWQFKQNGVFFVLLWHVFAFSVDKVSEWTGTALFVFTELAEFSLVAPSFVCFV